MATANSAPIWEEFQQIEISTDTPNTETIEALEEVEQMKKILHSARRTRMLTK